MEQTFAVIKPDAFAAGHAGQILARIYEAGFSVVGLKKLWLSEAQAGGFYHEHQGKPFFADLTGFMSSGPCLVMVLQAPNAVLKWRELMGATDPAAAAAGTLRRDFGTAIGRNATHGSDAVETAAFEINYFFAGLELL
ncbi:MAG: nucleoside-diphosphate kinase [Desulfuromonadales bacterium C00003096]|jgi:nucleoside-diphosphate kinase|nr:MAG: nucleoside-diphosphate kinase [Desulfuromonadales bacterium C00003096]